MTLKQLAGAGPAIHFFSISYALMTSPKKGVRVVVPLGRAVRETRRGEAPRPRRDPHGRGKVHLG